MAVLVRRKPKELLEHGLQRLQKLLAALPAQQRLTALQYLSERLRSALLRHMELQHLQRCDSDCAEKGPTESESGQQEEVS
ncbi:unnamed protein product [Durusdinium trenchii]|uniref:Uncharacterized protein n=1 Tax=Durusdinium trenchii TaxID=1381693 RepID=A0ABP0IKU5_9DINO